MIILLKFRNNLQLLFNNDPFQVSNYNNSNSANLKGDQKRKVIFSRNHNKEVWGNFSYKGHNKKRLKSTENYHNKLEIVILFRKNKKGFNSQAKNLINPQKSRYIRLLQRVKNNKHHHHSRS